MSILAIVPARSGSRRIPGKNLRSFCGKPLLQWTVEQAARIKEIDRAILTTDYTFDDFHAAGTTDCENGKKVLYHRRPDHLCGPDVPMAQVICDVLANEREWPDLCVLLQPTSPSRTDETVRKCIQAARGGFPAYTVRHIPYPGGCGHIEMNGACYAFNPHHLPPFDDTDGRETEIRTDDIDIDTEEQFLAAEALMKARGHGSHQSTKH